MQSSYNVIKKYDAVSGSEKSVDTVYKNVEEVEEEVMSINGDYLMKRYEALGNNIIRNSKSKSEKIINDAIISSNKIEKTAYEKGYEQGSKNGYEDGYNKGIEEARIEYEAKARTIIGQAEYILKTAKEDYDNYMSDKRCEIINLSLEIAKVITKRELIDLDGISDLIENVLENAKGEENIIIRINPCNVESIREKSDEWKVKYGIKEEIFILEDSFTNEGNAFIEKTTGKTEVGIDIGFQGIEEYLKGRISK